MINSLFTFLNLDSNELNDKQNTKLICLTLIYIHEIKNNKIQKINLFLT